MPNEPKTDAGLLDRLHRVAQREMSAQEVRRQRVSFVYGNLPHDHPMTKHDVEKAIARLEGAAA